MAVLHRLDVERLIRKAGAQRVSEDAGEKLTEFLEDKAIEIIEKAMTIARHARGRKAKKLKLTAEDILLAAS
ncbi:NFYB/HAP3 family transcription factor subunit [Candidatus Micrarchaeota archaeon]|nr:NFYB/HAP3 family transcription factor subunit [Candidatus Micrarchaeota archaeon]